MGLKLVSGTLSAGSYTSGTFTVKAKAVSGDRDLTDAGTGITATYTKVGGLVFIRFASTTGLIYAGNEEGVTFYLCNWPTTLIPTVGITCPIHYTVIDNGDYSGYLSCTGSDKWYVTSSSLALVTLASSSSNNFALKYKVTGPPSSTQVGICYSL